MTKLARRRAPLGVISKVCTIGIPLTHSRRAREHSLFGRDRNSAAKHRDASALTRRWVLERLLAKHRWGIRSRSQGAHPTSNAIQMKLLDLPKNRVARAWMSTLDHVERILADP